MTTRTYRTPGDYKAALEAKLKQRANDRLGGIQRLRQRFVMERFLTRVVEHFGSEMTLKGGLALELRLSNARSTKDIDLRTVGDPDAILARLQGAAMSNTGDWLSFTVAPDSEHPDIGDAVYGGRRFRVACTLASRPYGGPFGVDVGIADPMHGPGDFLDGEDFLDFLAVPPVRIRAYPIETHIAEKLHAYTRVLVVGRENSRHRDLPDLALLAGIRPLRAASLREAIETTFTFRKAHGVPACVPPPPATWENPYLRLAQENALPWRTLLELHAAVVAFLNPLLSGHDGEWDHVAKVWRKDS